MYSIMYSENDKYKRRRREPKELRIGKKLTNLTCKRQEMSISKEADHGVHESNPQCRSRDLLN